MQYGTVSTAMKWEAGEPRLYPELHHKFRLSSAPCSSQREVEGQLLTSKNIPIPSSLKQIAAGTVSAEEALEGTSVESPSMGRIAAVYHQCHM